VCVYIYIDFFILFFLLQGYVSLYLEHKVQNMLSSFDKTKAQLLLCIYITHLPCTQPQELHKYIGQQP
jgi:hypothetical protein